MVPIGVGATGSRSSFKRSNEHLTARCDSGTVLRMSRPAGNAALSDALVPDSAAAPGTDSRNRSEPACRWWPGKEERS